jgi:hypothetical protein
MQRSTSSGLKLAARLSPPLGHRRPVDRAVLADGRVGAAARLNPADALGLQGTGPGEELGVLLGVDVVGDHRQLQAIAQPPAQRFHQGGFSRSHRPGHPHAQLAHRPAQLLNNRE